MDVARLQKRLADAGRDPGPVDGQLGPKTYRALFDYMAKGGRTLASHWHRTWFSEPPEGVPPLGTWQDRDDPTQDGAPIAAPAPPAGRARH